MSKFSSFYLSSIIILIMNLEAIGNVRNLDADCGKCGRRIPMLEGAGGPDRIINGRQVKPPWKYPWIVKAVADRTCSGSIISSKYILTSAYCLTKNNSDIDEKCLQTKVPSTCFVDGSELKFRIPWRESSKFRKTLNTVKLIPHPDYDHFGKRNDIALVEIAEDIECTSFYQPICLPIENFSKSGRRLTITGWGSTTSDGSEDGSKALREGQMMQTSFLNCEFFSKKAENSSTSLCVEATEEAQSPAKGDSGAAMFAVSGKAYYALGVSNMAEGNPLKPIAFTKVNAYIDWIKNYVEKFPEPYTEYVKVEDLEIDLEDPEPDF